MAEKTISRRGFLKDGFVNNHCFQEKERKIVMLGGAAALMSISPWEKYTKKEASVIFPLAHAGGQTLMLTGFLFRGKSNDEELINRRMVFARTRDAFVAGTTTTLVANTVIAAFSQKKYR